MSRKLLVGIDIGTTSAKSVLFSITGEVLAEAAQEYPTHYPQPNWAEQDPEEWWRATSNTLQLLFASGEYAAEDVAALGVSSQAPSVVPLDAGGDLIRPAMIWMDRRSDPQCDWLRHNVDPKLIASINGGRIDPYFMAPKLLWYRDEQTQLYDKTDAVLQANGYIVYRLTGALSMDASHGALSLLFDGREQKWSHKLIDAMGLNADMLPPVFGCSETVGEVTRVAALECGLPAGTPVIAGMVDGTAASLEAGVVEPGDAVEMTGQTTVLMICSDQPYLDDKLIPLGHAIAGRHLVVGAQVATGGSLRWFRDQLGETERQAAKAQGRDAFELLSEEAASSPPGANGLIFLPYMYGERSPIWDSQARGVFFGLSLATTKADLVRAIMEGAAYGLRHNIEAAANAGFTARQIASVGGGARSPLWNQIKADILRRRVHVPRTATGAPLGDAIAAAAAVGIHPSIQDAVQRMTKPGVVYQPNAELKKRYDALYHIYTELYPSLKASFDRLAQTPE